MCVYSSHYYFTPMPYANDDVLKKRFLKLLVIPSLLSARFKQGSCY